MDERRSAGLIFVCLAVVAVMLLVSLGFVWRYAQWQRAHGPGAAQEHVDRGHAQLRSGDAALAILSFSQAIKLDPALADAYGGRGLAHRQIGDTAGALRDLTKAMTLAPEDSVHVRRRSEVHESSGRLDEAIADYSTVLELDGEDGSVLAARGWANVRLGRYAGAVADLDRSRDLVPDNHSVLHHLAWAHWGEGRYDSAVEAYTASIDLGRPGLHAWFGRGAGHLHAGAWAAAEDDLARASAMVGRGQDYAAMYLWVARARRGDRGAADAGLRAFMERPGRFVRPWSTSIHEFLLGERSEDELLRRARSDRTQEPAGLGALCEAYYYAAIVRLIEGDEATAVDHLRKCMSTEVTNFYEYYAAQAELRRLERE